ncbi:hypothetical protein KAR91_68660 [Candidatus Pacearchaeota archaeon]|nr:hypothetical protein [Candidatus Pacearchaeota archaeon]
MSKLSEIVGKLYCNICPFITCEEAGACYNCHCFIDEDIDLENYCDDPVVHPECPLMTGLIITVSKTDNDELKIGKSYQ